MQNLITPVAPTTPAPPVESRPSPKAPSTHAFATLLRQSQSAAPDPAKAAPVKPTSTGGTADVESTVATTRAPSKSTVKAIDARRTDDSRTDADRVDTKTGDKRTDDSGADASADTAKRDTKDSAASTSDVAGTGIPVSHGLVALHRPIATAPEGGTSDKAGRSASASTAKPGEAAEGDGAATSSAPSTGALASRGAADGSRKDEPATLARLGNGTGDTAPIPSADLAAAIARTMPFAPSELRSETSTPVAIAATPELAHANPATPVEATVATPLTAPDFAQALAVQVSVLVHDGVQRAELHLNPSEMGPVSVRIVVDGTQARIDFGADTLATRQAIEAGLPELAASLREAGMTLQGGGVSQHARDPDPRGPPGEGSAGPSRGLFGTEELRPAQVARQRVVSAGGVDLYA